MTMFRRWSARAAHPGPGSRPSPTISAPNRPRQLGISRIDPPHAGDLLWVDRSWPSDRHEQELLAPSALEEVLDGAEVVSLLDRGLRA
jgi:hypothetical protein